MSGSKIEKFQNIGSFGKFFSFWSRVLYYIYFCLLTASKTYKQHKYDQTAEKIAEILLNVTKLRHLNVGELCSNIDKFQNMKGSFPHFGHI